MNRRPGSNLRKLSAGELSAICSNLRRGCGVQQLARNAEPFGRIAVYFRKRAVAPDHKGVVMLSTTLNSDMVSYPRIREPPHSCRAEAP